MAGAPLLGLALLAWCLVPPAFWDRGTAPFQRPVLYGLAVAYAWTFLQVFLPLAGRGASAFWTPALVLRDLVPGLLLGAAVLRVLRRLAPGAQAWGLILSLNRWASCGSRCPTPWRSFVKNGERPSLSGALQASFD